MPRPGAPERRGLVVAVAQRLPRTRTALLLLLAVAGLVGIAARLAILADRPLAIDEYYIVVSVESILEHGLPAFETGGYYVRGLPFQYMLAGVAAALGETLFAYRLVSFALSLLSVALAWLYARRFLSPSLATAVAIALLLSSWHIEFAGFIRMYALFQCTTLLFLIALDDAYFRGAWQRRYLPHAMALLSTLSHELGVTLVPLLFLPLVAGGPPGGFLSILERVRFAAAGLVTAALCFLIVEGDLRGLGVTDPYPPGYVPQGWDTPFHLPVFPFGLGPTLALAALVALAAVAVWRLWRHRLEPADLWLAVLVVASAAHLFVVSAIALAVLLLRFDLHRPALHPRWRYALVLVAALLGLAWLGYALADPATLLAQPRIAERWDLTEAGLAKALWTTLVGWPDLYRGTIYPFAVEMPGLGLALAVALAVVLIAWRHAPLAELLRLPWVALVSTMLIYGVVQGQYAHLRYFYHLHPSILCVVALALAVLAGRLAARRPGLSRDGLAAGGFLALIALLSDFSPAHLAHIRDDAVAFRTGPFEDHLLTWYTRTDFRSPAAFMNAQPLADTAAVVIEYHFPISWELEPPHAIYIPRQWHDLFPLHSRVGGTVDLWSNRPLLSTPDELAAHTRDADTVWLLRGTDRSRSGLPEPPAVWGDRLVEQGRAFLSRDGRIEVVRVRLLPPRGMAGATGCSVSEQGCRRAAAVVDRGGSDGGSGSNEP